MNTWKVFFTIIAMLFANSALAHDQNNQLPMPASWARAYDQLQYSCLQSLSTAELQANPLSFVQDIAKRSAGYNGSKAVVDFVQRELGTHRDCLIHITHMEKGVHKHLVAIVTTPHSPDYVIANGQLYEAGDYNWDVSWSVLAHIDGKTTRLENLYYTEPAGRKEVTLAMLN